MGHEGVLTTFFSYGEVQPTRQAEILKNLGNPKSIENQGFDMEAMAKIVAREVNGYRYK